MRAPINLETSIHHLFATPTMSFRILHTADLHGRIDWLRWLRRQARDFDLVCIAGDLLDLREDQQIKMQIDQISALLRSFPAPLAISSGNHDMVHDDAANPGRLWLEALRRENLWIDGDRFNLGGHTFRCLGWGNPVPPANAGEIWITHAPPDRCEVGLNRREQDRGDHELGEVCRSGWGPQIALCGHVHEARGWQARVGSTLILNPGHSPAATFPSHCIVDLGRGSAEWRRLLGVIETVAFGERRLEVLLAGLGDLEIEALLIRAIASLRAEGTTLTPSEIAEFRQRLRALARNT